MELTQGFLSCCNLSTKDAQKPRIVCFFGEAVGKFSALSLSLSLLFRVQNVYLLLLLLPGVNKPPDIYAHF